MLGGIKQRGIRVLDSHALPLRLRAEIINIAQLTAITEGAAVNGCQALRYDNIQNTGAADKGKVPHACDSLFNDNVFNKILAVKRRTGGAVSRHCAASADKECVGFRVKAIACIFPARAL